MLVGKGLSAHFLDIDPDSVLCQRNRDDAAPCRQRDMKCGPAFDEGSALRVMADLDLLAELPPQHGPPEAASQRRALIEIAWRRAGRKQPGGWKG